MQFSPLLSPIHPSSSIIGRDLGPAELAVAIVSSIASIPLATASHSDLFRLVVIHITSVPPIASSSLSIMLRASVLSLRVEVAVSEHIALISRRGDLIQVISRSEQAVVMQAVVYLEVLTRRRFSVLLLPAIIINLGLLADLAKRLDDALGEVPLHLLQLALVNRLPMNQLLPIIIVVATHPIATAAHIDRSPHISLIGARKPPIPPLMHLPSGIILLEARTTSSHILAVVLGDVAIIEDLEVVVEPFLGFRHRDLVHVVDLD